MSKHFGRIGQNGNMTTSSRSQAEAGDLGARADSWMGLSTFLDQCWMVLYPSNINVNQTKTTEILDLLLINLFNDIW